MKHNPHSSNHAAPQLRALINQSQSQPVENKILDVFGVLVFTAAMIALMFV